MLFCLFFVLNLVLVLVEVLDYNWSCALLEFVAVVLCLSHESLFEGLTIAYYRILEPLHVGRVGAIQATDISCFHSHIILSVRILSVD